MHCPFCQLDSTDDRVIQTGGLTYTILSDPRLLAGHTLVIPRRHIVKPWELRPPELLAIFQEIDRLRQRLLTVAEGVDVRQNYRPFLAPSKLKVDHVHFHVLPRTNKDVLYQKSMRYETELFDDLPAAERQQFRALLR
jgi:diadenosine tetraphosphate (Ap4A) HIT family hydrolase